MAKVLKKGDLESASSDPEELEGDLISAREAYEVEEAELKTRRKLPPIPAKVEFEEMVAWLGKLTAEQKKHTKIYVYRKWPWIDRKMADPDRPKYIEIFDSDDEGDKLGGLNKPHMISTHGGGRYEFWILDLDRASRQKVAEARLEIPMAEAEPQVNMEELLIDHPKNQAFVNLMIAKGKLRGDGSIVEDSMTAPGIKPGGEVQFVTATLSKLVDRLLDERRREGQAITPGIEREALNKSLEMTTEAYKMAMNNALSRDDKTAAEELERLLNIVKGMQPDTKGDDRMFGLFQTMLTMQTENQKTMIELMKAQNTGGGDVEKMKGLFEIVGLAKDTFGGGGKGSTLETVLSHSGPILSNISQIVANVVSLRKGGPVQPIEKVPEGQGQIGQGASSQPGEQAMTVESVIRQYGQYILQHVNGGTKGDDFVDLLGDVMGRSSAMSLHAGLSSVGNEGLLQVMESIPEFWSQVKDKEVLKDFVDRFVRYHELGPVEEVPEGGAGGVQ